MSDDFSSLGGLWAACWDRLSARPAPLLALATTRSQGAAARMVVLRAEDPIDRILTVYTNAQSDKVAELDADPHAEFLLWDPCASFQARIAARVSMRPASEAEWDALSLRSRLNYARDPAPGEPIAAPNARMPTPDMSLMCVLTARIETLDLVHLGSIPHVRAIFTRKDDFQGRWIAP